jgi:hypothetical protein
MGNIKKPKELFEEKDFKTESLSVCSDIDKSIVSPKIFFKENKENEFGNLLAEYTLPSELCNDEQSSYVKDDNNVQKLFKDLSEDLYLLKEDINTTKKYGREINFIKRYIKNIEQEISKENSFDPSNIYEGLTFVRREIQKVRSEIPTIPEPISYEIEFNQLNESINAVKESIPIIPEIKYYDNEIVDLLKSIHDVKEEIDNLPEVKYYDHQISDIEERINIIKETINSIPEIKYYDEDMVLLEEKILEVQSLIPVVPEVRYYENEILELENKFVFLRDTIDNLPELPEVKYYDNDIFSLNEQIEELKTVINSLPEPKYYDEEVKKLYEKIEIVKNSIPEPQIIPEIKYYDEEVDILQKEVILLSKRISDIKIPDTKIYTDRLEKFYKEFQNKSFDIHQKITNLQELFEKLESFQKEQIVRDEEFEQKLNEAITAEPPEIKNKDPLSPLERDFVTFEELSNHYRLFINRIQQQLSTIGGGNEITTLKGLDDVVGVSTNGAAYDGKYLRYNHSTQTFIPEAIIIGGGEVSGTLTGLFDTDISNLQDGHLMVYDSNSAKFVFVDPQTYFGINADSNPNPLIDDYGTYN